MWLHSVMLSYQLMPYPTRALIDNQREACALMVTGRLKFAKLDINILSSTSFTTLGLILFLWDDITNH